MVKQKTGVESVMKNFFKRNSAVGVDCLLLRKATVAQNGGKTSEQKLIRPVKYAEVEFICKELIVLLINQGISLEDATKVFENKLSADGKITCADICETMQG